MAMQEDPEWRRVLLLLTAVVLLIAMASTAALFLGFMGTGGESDTMLSFFLWGILLFSLSPYVFLFVCRRWMVTDLQASVLLWGSVAISVSSVFVLLFTVTQGNDPLRGVVFFILPEPQWVACVVLLVCIKTFARPK